MHDALGGRESAKASDLGFEAGSPRPSPRARWRASLARGLGFAFGLLGLCPYRDRPCARPFSTRVACLLLFATFSVRPLIFLVAVEYHWLNGQYDQLPITYG